MEWNAWVGSLSLVIIIIIKGHSLRRACLQPATNTQNSKPRHPTTNARSKGKLQNKTLLETQHRLTTPLHTSRYSARFAPSRGRSICSVWPRLPMSCMAVSIHVRWGRPMGLECEKRSCLTMTSLGSRPGPLKPCTAVRTQPGLTTQAACSLPQQNQIKLNQYILNSNNNNTQYDIE